MKQINKKQFVLESQMSSMKIGKNLAIYFLLKMSLFLMLTLSSCSTNTYGQSQKKLANDEIKVKIYKSGVAKQEAAEVKLKKFIDKELSDNNYVDYIVLHQCDVNYRIKFFRTLQDKYAFLGKIENDKYLDSLQIDSKCNNVHIAEQVLLFKSNSFICENLTKSKFIMSIYGAGASCNFAKGGEKYYLVMNYISLKKVYGNKHILNINLNNGAKILLSPFPEYICVNENFSTVLVTTNREKFKSSNILNPKIPIYNSTDIKFSYKSLGFLYPISIDQLQEMSKYEIASISLSDGSLEIFNTDNMQSVGFIKNDAKYILDN